MWFVAALCLSFAQARPPTPGDAGAEAFRDALMRMIAVTEGLTDYTQRFYTQEWVGGRLTQRTAIEVRFRAPHDIYMKWVEGDHVGRHLLYRGPEWNGGKLKVDPGAFVPVVSLDPEGRMARSGNRHTVRELPMAVLVGKITTDARKVNDHPTWTPDVTDLGVRDVGGETGRCFDSRVPKAEDPSLYAYRVELCVSEATGLPNSVRIWDLADGEVRLVEDYQYLQTRLDVGLTDADFDPATLGL